MSRFAAAAVIGYLTGALGFFLFGLFTLAIDRQVPGGDSLGDQFVSLVALSVAYAGAFGVVLGTIPSILIMFLSAARMKPWHSLPTLLLGSVAGFVLGAIGLLGIKDAIGFIGELILLTVTATLGQAIAARVLTLRNRVP